MVLNPASSKPLVEGEDWDEFDGKATNVIAQKDIMIWVNTCKGFINCLSAALS